MDSLEALDEAILNAMLASYEDRPGAVIERQQETLREALSSLRSEDAQKQRVEIDKVQAAQWAPGWKGVKTE